MGVARDLAIGAVAAALGAVAGALGAAAVDAALKKAKEMREARKPKVILPQ
jgi:hypothetical protein